MDNGFDNGKIIRVKLLLIDGGLRLVYFADSEPFLEAILIVLQINNVIEVNILFVVH